MLLAEEVLCMHTNHVQNYTGLGLLGATLTSPAGATPAVALRHVEPPRPATPPARRATPLLPLYATPPQTTHHRLRPL